MRGGAGRCGAVRGGAGRTDVLERPITSTTAEVP